MPTVSAAARAAWQLFLDAIDRALERVGCTAATGEEAWFRGHADARHTLLPSLFRKFPDPNGKDWAKIWDLESDLYWEFSSRARELHTVLRHDWDYLFAMQHFRTPTRLLDWTEVLGVAVYFATLGVDDAKARQSPPCVWVMNPFRLNRESEGDEDEDLYAPEYLTRRGYAEQLLTGGIGFDWPRAIYPRQTNARLHAQRAWFTIHGDEFLPIDGMEYAAALERVDLPPEALPAVRQFLAHAGIDHYLLFGDLENLSRYLREKNGL